MTKHLNKMLMFSNYDIKLFTGRIPISCIKQNLCQVACRALV